jgi:hypothetical protein
MPRLIVKLWPGKSDQPKQSLAGANRQRRDDSLDIAFVLA